MNLVGKIFVVLILVMSLVFMAFAMMVYSTHKSWQEAVSLPREQATGGKQPGLKFQLADERAKTTALQEELERLKQTLESERQTFRQRLAAAEGARARAAEDLTRLEGEYDKIKLESDKRLASLTVAQQNETALRTEVEGLREEIRTAQKARDEAFAQVVQMTDELQQAKSEWERLRALNDDLVSKVTTMDLTLQDHNINPYSESTPPRVDGLVVATNDRGMVEINLGTDDGLRKGHQLEVISNNKYLGRIEVIRAEPDQSAAMVLPAYRQGPIQKGDSVRSRLN
jgi:chromosome segregation ATPase